MSARPGLGHKISAIALTLACGLAPPPAAMAQPIVLPQSAADAPAAAAPEGAAATPDAPVARTPELSEAEANAARLAANQKALSEIEASITVSKERADALRREIQELEGDPAKQNAALIGAAQRVKLAEIEIDDVEERLGDLIVDEFEVRGRLDGADADIANVLAALQRISRNPPPALMVDPTDALGSARSAILMSSILPELRAKADAVTTDLRRLTEIKAAALREEELLKANFAVLEEEQLRIATLITARKQGVERISADLATEEKEALELAARATSLKELINSLSTQASDVVEANRTAPAPGTSLTPEAIRVALADTSRKEPAIPFSSAKGYLTLPSSGVRVVDFGASDGFGGIAHGLSMVTRASAQVVAPADGWVMYKGPYLNYGEIVILNPGEDYTILLAGLETASVNIGQFVMMGEPIGTMGSRTIGRTVTTSAGGSRPTLYIELRKNNEPVDPTGWWLAQSNSTQSG